MAHKPRSVGERLRSTGLIESRLEIAVEWKNRWQDQHVLLISALEFATDNEQIGFVRKNLGQIKEMSKKNFDALANIIGRLSDPNAKTVDGRLRSEKSLEFRRGIAAGWAHDWRVQHDMTIRALESAASTGNIDLAREKIDQLNLLSQKNFGVLENTIAQLSAVAAGTGEV